MAWWDSLLSYGQNNPLEALSLGVGAAGTGMGIYDMIRANQERADQARKMEQLYRMGPEAFMPRQTSAQLAAYLKPYQADLATRGIDPSGGSGQSALADALLKNYLQLYQTGQNTYGQKLQALGLMQPPTGGGDTGAFGKALAYAMMARAAQQRNQTQPGIADVSAFDTSIPDLSLQDSFATGRMGSDQPYSLKGP